MSVPPPSTESLQHRAEIAKLLSPLRRALPRVPFWKLAAHRIPTLWMLYRRLLRHAEHEHVRIDVLHDATADGCVSRSDIALGRYFARTDTQHLHGLPRSSWSRHTKYMSKSFPSRHV